MPPECLPPLGSYRDAEEWSQAAGSGGGPGREFKELYPAHTMRLPKPAGIEESFWSLEQSLPRAYAAVIPNGRLWGKHDCVITPDNRVLKDVSRYPGKVHDIFLQEELDPPLTTSKTVATIAFACSGIYFHWIYDYLPRLHLLQKSGYSYDLLAIDEPDRRFQYETLAMLGIPDNRILRIPWDSNDFHLQAKRLVVPSALSMTQPEWSCAAIRELLLPHCRPVRQREFERLYVSRDDSGIRRVVNEDEVFELLKRFGFRKVTLDGMPLSEQIALFQSAKVIAGPHGSNLSNLVFCNPETTVIEFTYYWQPTFDGFYKICHYNGLRYFYVLCDKAAPLTPYYHWDDILVDLTKLYRTLELAGL